MITLTPSTAVANTYSLNWNYQQNHVLEGLKSLMGQDDVLLTDVTLACDGEYIHAHKLVLSLCSSFFKDLFMKNKADKSSTIIILGNVSALNLRYLLNFIYQGKVDIPSKDVDSFLQAGKMLQIEGLIGNAPESEQVNAQTQPNHNQTPVQRHDSSSHRPTRSNVPHSSSASSSIKTAGSSASVESPSVPAKKPRLSETNVVEHSPVESTPVILGQPVTLGGVQPPGGEVDDPLNDSHQYEQEEEGEMEEGIDFNHLKTEPIQVYSGYDDSHHSDMMHESMGEDSYGGSVDESYGIPQSHSHSSSMAIPSTSMSQMSSQPGTSSNTRTRANVPDVKQCCMQLAGEAFTNAYVIKRAIPEFSRLQSEIYTFFTWRHKDRLWKCSLCPTVLQHHVKCGTATLSKHFKMKHPEIVFQILR